MPDDPAVGPPEPETSHRRVIVEGLLIAAMALTINLVGNGRVGLWDRDEPRYAVATREMRERGDWIAPSFNGEPRYHKPIFIYWVMGVGTAIFGDTPYGARLGSAVAGAGTCLLTWWLGRRMFGPVAGRLAALALASAPIMVVESKLATTDATLTVFLAAAQACLWTLHRRPSRLAAGGFWASMALATLTKGPVGPALIAASGLASWWFRGPTAGWRRLHWRAGLALFAALTLPWYVAIGIVTGGDFYRFAVGVQMVQRATTKLEEHGGFPGFYPITTMMTFFPWSALVPAAIMGVWARRKGSPTFGFLLGWAIGPLLVLEPFRTKLIHYYLPAIPGLALMVGWLIDAVGRDVVGLRRWLGGKFAVGYLGGIGIAATAGLVAASFLVPAELRWPIRTLAVVLAAGTLAALARFERGAPIAAGYALAACWALMGVGITGWLLPSAEPYRLSRRVGEGLAKFAASERAKPILLTYQEPGIHYAMKLKAPTLRDWDEIHRLLDSVDTLVTAVTAEQYDGLCLDKRFRIDLLEDLDGFNISKGKAQSLRLARIRLSEASLTMRANEKALVK